ncbi:MAG: hypothetical protein IKF95_03130, partial [Firmicutes bacterium]|nr:hypothetical protein [Bacillota bacterium]
KFHFTHVEFMPLAEHPFDGSWGYQSTGFFSPTSRYGSANELQELIDRLHNAGIGAILDFVPAEEMDIMSLLGMVSENLDKNAAIPTADQIRELMDLNNSFRLMYILE